MFKFLRDLWRAIYSVFRTIYYVLYELFHDGYAGGKRKQYKR
uniref:Uncharacterized protein n=1 Tax=viral metagenome TaxID=1070528 RepID=A0A6C0CSC9_9ZZZZ